MKISSKNPQSWFRTTSVHVLLKPKHLKLLESAQETFNLTRAKCIKKAIWFFWTEQFRLLEEQKQKEQEEAERKRQETEEKRRLKEEKELEEEEARERELEEREDREDW